MYVWYYFCYPYFYSLNHNLSPLFLFRIQAIQLNPLIRKHNPNVYILHCRFQCILHLRISLLRNKNRREGDQAVYNLGNADGKKKFVRKFHTLSNTHTFIIHKFKTFIVTFDFVLISLNVIVKESIR